MSSDTTPEATGRGGPALRTDHARHDPALALADIARPIGRGKRPKGLRVQQEYAGQLLTVTCYEALDATDESILLALLALAACQDKPRVVDQDTEGEIGRQLWLELRPEGKQRKGRYGLVVETTAYAVLREAGLGASGGSQYRYLGNSLYRLSQVGVRVQGAGGETGMHLLAYTLRDDGALVVTLNERFARVLTGEDPQHVRYSLLERRQLASDAAQILHSRLTASLSRPGSEWTWRLDSLAERVWGEAARSGATARKRRQRLREALGEIEELGWHLRYSGSSRDPKVTVKRPDLVEQRVSA